MAARKKRPDHTEPAKPAVVLPAIDGDHVRESEALLDALTEMFENGADADRCYEYDLTPYLYSTIPLPNLAPTGGEIARMLLSGAMDMPYSLPRDEFMFFFRTSRLLKESFQSLAATRPITYVSLGCGPSSAVEGKDIPVVRAIGASRYIGLDLNPNYARFAAAQVNATLPHVQTESLVTSFADPFSLEAYAKDSQIVFGMMGDTIGQFPALKEGEDEGSIKGLTLNKLLDNWSAITDGTALLLATTDGDQYASGVQGKYSGMCMFMLMGGLWDTIQVAAQDPTFDPNAISYSPFFDKDLMAIKFAFRAYKETALTIRGKTYSIPYMTKFVIGCSQKKEPEELYPTFEKAGWKPFDLSRPIHYGSTTRFLSMAGPKFNKG